MTVKSAIKAQLSRPPKTVVALALLATSLSACGYSSSKAAAPSKAPTVSSKANAATDDLSFYAALRPSGNVLLKRQPESLRAAYDEATATVLAEVADVRPGRTINDLQFIVVELDTKEVLQGVLRPELGGKVLLEFPAAFLPDSTGPVIEEMRAAIPVDGAIWLIRWQGEPPIAPKPGVSKDNTVDPTMYATVHPNSGVFVQGANGVIAATAQTTDGGRTITATGAQAEGERFASLVDLAAHARNSK